MILKYQKKTFINEISKDVENILIHSAKTTFGTQNRTNSYLTKPNTRKPWFNNKCKDARKAYHTCKRNYHFTKNQANTSDLKKAIRHYKRTLRNKLLVFKKEFRKKLKSMKSSKPKDYWNYINSINKKKRIPDVDINVFYDFYKKLNADETDNSAEPNAEFPSIDFQNNLNAEISVEEIHKAVRSLKNGKASGLDLIINEYIKNSIDKLTDLYYKLFNMILTTGYLPESWTIGCILPIYKNKGDVLLPENYRPITLLSRLGKLYFE